MEEKSMSLQISFVGHLSVDRNVVKGRERVLYGGGVFHGAITARRLGAETQVLTMCHPDNRAGFSLLSEIGVDVTYLESPESTSIRNVYPSDDPDERQSAVLTRARPFTEDDLREIDHCELLHLNALWKGEIPSSLIPVARERTDLLAGDAQGFLRHVELGGEMVHLDWEDKAELLPLFDYFKVDIAEARILTGLEDPPTAARRLHEWGAKTVVLTHREGVCVHDGSGLYEGSFGPYVLEGRTGRGDTCTVAFLVAMAEGDIAAAVHQAAAITTRKMQYPGPYRG